MTDSPAPINVAIIDYELGNLFSVAQACTHVGMTPAITADRQRIEHADLVIMPGVGAFGDAMATLHRLDLVGVLRDRVAAGRLLVGICLGIQLLMTESYEFGVHKGLDIIEGAVVQLEDPREGGRRLKVPQVQWNRVTPAPGARWHGTPLDGMADGEFMYFVHSFVARPADPRVILARTQYGQIDFCASLRQGNVFACQFHPERSGPAGLKVYANLARAVRLARGEAA